MRIIAASMLMYTLSANAIGVVIPHVVVVPRVVASRAPAPAKIPVKANVAPKEEIHYMPIVSPQVQCAEEKRKHDKC